MSLAGIFADFFRVKEFYSHFQNCLKINLRASQSKIFQQHCTRFFVDQSSFRALTAGAQPKQRDHLASILRRSARAQCLHAESLQRKLWGCVNLNAHTYVHRAFSTASLRQRGFIFAYFIIFLQFN